MTPAILLTGAGGFIGQAVTHELNQNNLDFYSVVGRQTCDLTHYEAIKQLPPVSTIIHLAGTSGLQAYQSHPHQMLQHNLNSTLNMLEWARTTGCKRLVLASSYIYGRPHYLPIDELHPVNPKNGYARSKYLSEQLGQQYSQDFGLEVVIARIFNVYGPFQPDYLLIPTIINQLTQPALYLKDACPKRDFVFVTDVAKALVQMATTPLPSRCEIFNLGSGESYRVDEVVQLLCQLSGLHPAIYYSHERRSQEVDDVIANIQKAQDMLRWQPQIDFLQGLRITLDTYFSLNPRH